MEESEVVFARGLFIAAGGRPSVEPSDGEPDAAGRVVAVDGTTLVSKAPMPIMVSMPAGRLVHLD